MDMTKIPLKFQVPTGIGDISWVYSKLVTLDRPLIFKIPNQKPLRAAPFLGLLPNVVKATYAPITTVDVIEQGNRFDMGLADMIDHAEKGFLPLHLNKHLEAGRRIESYIPEMDIDYHYKIDIPPYEREMADSLLGGMKRYLVMYCANDQAVKNWMGWTPGQWSRFAQLFVPHYDIEGVVLIGADWDQSFGGLVVKQLAPHFKVLNLIGRCAIGTTLEIIKSAFYTVAFPSGIPILASVLNCPVYMHYPKQLEDMPWTWVDTEQQKNGMYGASIFNPPETVFTWVRHNVQCLAETESPA